MAEHQVTGSPHPATAREMAFPEQTLPFRRIIYVSQAMGGADLLAILRQSRANNGIDGVTGVLAFNGTLFGQVLEGPPESVVAALDRIRRDPRHTAVVVVSDTLSSERMFAEWTMAGLSGDLSGVLRVRLEQLLEHASLEVRNAFELG